MDSMNRKLMCFLSFVFVLFSSSLFAQSSTSGVVAMDEEELRRPYDSLDNFLGENVKSYIGQELYLIGKQESLRELGYSGFVKDYVFSPVGDLENIYQCCQGTHSIYDSLQGRFFQVLNVFPHPKTKQGQMYKNVCYLQLLDKRAGDTLYFEYDTEVESSFPFLTTGFYQKYNSKLVGQEYYLSYNLTRDLVDFNSGDSIRSSNTELWRCIQIKMDEKDYKVVVILQNALKEMIAVPLSFFVHNSGFNLIYTKSRAAEMIRRFGEPNVDLIFAGTVEIGMSYVECKLALGEPENVIYQNEEGSSLSVWIYPTKRLYFKDRLLHKIE